MEISRDIVKEIMQSADEFAAEKNLDLKKLYREALENRVKLSLSEKTNAQN